MTDVIDNLPLQFHPDARIEAIEAHGWYAERSTSAAEAFQDELQDARRAIQAAPDRWAQLLIWEVPLRHEAISVRCRLSCYDRSH